MASITRNVSLSPLPSGRNEEHVDEDDDEGSSLNVKNIANRFNHNKRKTSFKPAWAKSSASKSTSSSSNNNNPMQHPQQEQNIQQQQSISVARITKIQPLDQQHTKTAVIVTPNNTLQKNAFSFRQEERDEVKDVKNCYSDNKSKEIALKNEENIPSKPRGRQLVDPRHVTSSSQEKRIVVNQNQQYSSTSPSTSTIENVESKNDTKNTLEGTISNTKHTDIKSDADISFQSKVKKFSKEKSNSEESTPIATFTKNVLVPSKKKIELVSSGTSTASSTSTHFWKNQIQKSNGNTNTNNNPGFRSTSMESNKVSMDYNNIDAGSVVTKDETLSSKETKTSENEVIVQEELLHQVNIWKNQRNSKLSSSITHLDLAQDSKTPSPQENKILSDLKMKDTESTSSNNLERTTSKKNVISAQVEFITTSDSVGNNIKLWKQREQQNETVMKPLVPSRWKKEQSLERSNSVPPTKDRTTSVDNINSLKAELKSKSMSKSSSSVAPSNSNPTENVVAEQHIEAPKQILASMSYDDDDNMRYQAFLNRNAPVASFESNDDSFETETMKVSLSFNQKKQNVFPSVDSNRPEDEEDNFEYETQNPSEPASPERKSQASDMEDAGTPLRSNRSLDISEDDDDDDDTAPDERPQYSSIPVSQLKQQLWGPDEKLKTWKSSNETNGRKIGSSASQGEETVVQSKSFEVVQVDCDDEKLDISAASKSVKVHSDDIPTIYDSNSMNYEFECAVNLYDEDPSVLPIKQQELRSLDNVKIEKDRASAGGDTFRATRSQDDDIVFKSRFYDAARIAHQRDFDKVEPLNHANDSDELIEPVALLDGSSKQNETVPSTSHHIHNVDSSSSDPGSTVRVRTQSVELLLEKLTAAITRKDNPDAALKEIDQILQQERKGLGVLRTTQHRQSMQHNLQPTIIEDESLGVSHFDEFANVNDGFSDDDDDDDDDYSDDDSTVSSITNPTYHESHIRSDRKSRAHQYNYIYQTGPQKGLPIPTAKPAVIPHSKLEKQISSLENQLRISGLQMDGENTGTEQYLENRQKESQMYELENDNMSYKATLPRTDAHMISTVKPFYEKGKSMNNKGLLKQIKHWEEEDEEDNSQGNYAQRDLDLNPPSHSVRLKHLANAVDMNDEDHTSLHRRRSLSANPDRSRVFYPNHDALSHDLIKNESVNLDANDWESIPGVDFFSSTRSQRRAVTSSSSKRFVEPTLQNYDQTRIGRHSARNSQTDKISRADQDYYNY